MDIINGVGTAGFLSGRVKQQQPIPVLLIPAKQLQNQVGHHHSAEGGGQVDATAGGSGSAHPRPLLEGFPHPGGVAFLGLLGDRGVPHRAPLPAARHPRGAVL